MFRTSIIALTLGMMLISACATTHAKRKGAFYPARIPASSETQRLANVRVALFQSIPRLRVASKEPVKIYDMNTRSMMADSVLKEESQLTPRNQHFMLNGQTLLAQKIRLVPAEKDFIKCNGQRFRGQIEVSCNARGGLLVVNFVPLEEYVKGVVPNEVQGNWPLEALKAQAVAARTFTLSRMGSSANAEFDVEANTNSQVYRGMDSEREATNQAVEGTAHLAATYQGRFISAFYHSNCGGHTADVRNVWGNDIVYLKGVACGFCDDSPHYNWSLTLSLKEITNLLSQRNIEFIRSIEVMGRLPDNRVLSLEIVHGGGKEIMKAPAFRMLLGPERLKSTNFEITPNAKSLVFKGKGWGHGVGLCQEGAYGMARAGYGFSEILEYYYPGIEIKFLE